MSDKKLATFVTVHRDGESTTFGPGEKLPKWAREQITNPNVWAEDDEGKAGEDGGGNSADAGGDGGGEESPLQVPPKAGAGSGADAWRAYAVEAAKRAGLNIELDDAASRGDIIAALDDAKIATE